MKFLRLIFRNATRNKRRAILTVLSISIAIVAISVLNTIVYAINAGVEMADESRLVMRNAISIIFPLPLSYRTRIAGMEGVKSVSLGNWFGGIYQDKKNFFAKFAVDAETYFPMYPEFTIPPDRYQEFLKDRKGCVVGKKLAAKYGFKVGDTVPVMGDIYPGDWEFNVRAIYEGTRKGADETMLLFHWKYLDESLPRRRQGMVGFYMIQLANPWDAGRVAKALDAEFENSPDQTLTETEKAFQTEFVKMMGNIELMVRSIGGAVVFAILLVAANTMAMAARERTTEIAIMKTIGFRSSQLACLVAAEGFVLTLAGWLLGCGVAWGVCRFVEANFSTFLPSFPLKLETILLALAVALFTGLVSVLFPAAHAARTSIVQGMREVA
jgi:putative ABC transport system permease protein